MAQLKPTSDTGDIAAIDSGEYTPRINLKPTTP
jgi:hypothetical protein